MNENLKNTAIPLIKKLLSSGLSKSEEDNLMLELDALLPDPCWSDYIFWNDDYLNEDTSLNYDKFFDKVFDYPNSEVL